jgi:TonB family protein
MGGLSLLIHFFLVVFLSLQPWPSIIRVHSLPYTVNLVSLSSPETEISKISPPPPINETRQKPISKPKKEDIIEKVKESKKEKPSLKHLEEALEELRKKVAIEEIQKRIAQREMVERKETPPLPPTQLPKPTTPSFSPPSKFESKSYNPPSKTEALLTNYYNLIWGKIKEAWKIPENLLKETVDQEAIIVLIIERDGKIQKLWFEKKSGNPIYDQTALRAIRKAEPFPPLPKEFDGNTLEIGIRFFPE